MPRETLDHAARLALMAVRHNEAITKQSDQVEAGCYSLAAAADKPIDLGQCYAVPAALSDLNYHLEAARNLRKAIDFYLDKRGIAGTPETITQDFVVEIQECLGVLLMVEDIKESVRGG